MSAWRWSALQTFPKNHSIVRLNPKKKRGKHQELQLYPQGIGGRRGFSAKDRTETGTDAGGMADQINEPVLSALEEPESHPTAVTTAAQGQAPKQVPFAQGPGGKNRWRHYQIGSGKRQG